MDVTNCEMSKVCEQYNNVHFADLNNLGKLFHTSHGLHLSRLGKAYVADKILYVSDMLAFRRAKNVVQHIALGYDPSYF